MSLSSALPVRTPPGCSTRAISRTARWGSGKQCRPVKLTTRSNSPSAKGSEPTSAITGSTWARTWRRRAEAIVRSSIRLGDVRGDVADPLSRTEAAQRDTPTGGHVEHRGPGRLAADLRGCGVQPPQVAADARLPQHATGLRVLHRPVVEARPQRVLAPAPEPGHAPVGQAQPHRAPASSRISARSISAGMPKASTRSSASGRTRRHSEATSRVIALQRVLDRRPCSMNQARSASMVERANRSQSSPRATLLSLATMLRCFSAKASSTRRSTWARPAAITWSCTG